MTVAFVVDAQLPPALAARLRERGYRAFHVADIGLIASADAEIAAWSRDNGAVIVTKDSDFVGLALRDPGVRVLWIRLGNTTSAALWAAVEPRMREVARAYRDGERIVELR